MQAPRCVSFLQACSTQVSRRELALVPLAGWWPLAQINCAFAMGRGRSRTPRSSARAAAEAGEQHIWPHGLSPAGFKLLRMWGAGGASASTLRELAESMVKTYGNGAEDVSRFASIGSHGHQPSHCQRDLLNSPQLANMRVPEPRPVEAYVFVHNAGITKIEKTTVYYFSICDWFDTMEKHGLLDQVVGPASAIKEFWSGVSPTDPKLYKNPVTKVKNYNKTFRPFELHGDAGPHQKHDSCNCYSVRSLLLKKHGETCPKRKYTYNILGSILNSFSLPWDPGFRVPAASIKGNGQESIIGSFRTHSLSRASQRAQIGMFPFWRCLGLHAKRCNLWLKKHTNSIAERKRGLDSSAEKCTTLTGTRNCIS